MGAELAVADVAIGLFIAISAVFGVLRGLVRELLSLVIWVAAIVLGLALRVHVGSYLGDLGPRLQSFAGFAIVFVAVLVAGALLQRLAGRLVQSTGLSGTDRTLGLLFGALRGVAVAVVALIVLKPFAADRDWWTHSRLVPPLLSLERDVLQLIDAAVGSLPAAEPAGAGARVEVNAGTQEI